MFTLRWVIGALIALMLVMMLKFYVIDIIKVNADDMKDSYYKGDVLLVQRAFNTYATNDIVYLRFPAKDTMKGKTFGFQRLIGLPGDTIDIRDKKIFLNNYNIQDTGTIRYNYYISVSEPGLDSAAMQRFRLTEGGKISAGFDYSYSLGKWEYENVKRLDNLTKLTVKCEQKGSFDQTVFPWSTRYSWNLDNFGKLYIPKKNDTLRLDSTSIDLYVTLIRDYEKNELEILPDGIFINDQKADRYVVRKNYYFVMGDNRDNSNDSRVFGPVPENFIRGKVIDILRREKE